MKNKYIYIAATILVLIVGFVFWMQNLDADPPMYYSGLGQGITTDPSMYVYHARNKVLFNVFDLFDDPRWTTYEHSLITLLGYIVFSYKSVSYQYTNLIGVILSFIGLIFFAAGLYDKKSPWQCLIFVLLFLTNITLYVYGRVPFLENILIFYSGILFYVISKWPDKLITIIANGIIISLATLTGKVFGLILLPAVGLMLFFQNGSNRWKNIVVLVIATITSLLVIGFLLYGLELVNALSFVSEQGAGMRGFPDGLKSPWAFFEHLIDFGSDVNFPLRSTV